MTLADISLTELEHDALTEVVNIGVSRAAASLRKMVGQQVLLSVPAVDVVSRTHAAALLGEREGDALIAVNQAFEGAFSGRALLIFPEANSLALVNAVTGEELSSDEVADLEEEALAETGNIILNNCLATMANMLMQPLTMSTPRVIRGDGPTLFRGEGGAEGGGSVLFLYINFSIRNRDIRGYIAMIMDLPSLASLKVLLADFIERVVGDD